MAPDIISRAFMKLLIASEQSESSESLPQAVGFTGNLRGMEALAWFRGGEPRVYGFSQQIIEELEQYRGDPNNVHALAKVVHAVWHEVQHKKTGTQEGLFSHTGIFYKALRKSLLYADIPVDINTLFSSN